MELSKPMVICIVLFACIQQAAHKENFENSGVYIKIYRNINSCGHHTYLETRHYCGNATFICLPDGNNYSIICRSRDAQAKHFDKSECPVLNNGHLEVESCEGSQCPNETYEVGDYWKYPACYERNSLTLPPTASSETTTSKNQAKNGNGINGWKIAFFVLIVVVVLLVAFYVYRHNTTVDKGKKYEAADTGDETDTALNESSTSLTDVGITGALGVNGRTPEEPPPSTSGENTPAQTEATIYSRPTEPSITPSRNTCIDDNENNSEEETQGESHPYEDFIVKYI